MDESRTVCIGVSNLYEAHPNGVLTYTDIEYEADRNIDGELEEYYDLRTKDGDLVCMDGESCNVLSKQDGVVTLLNTEGEVDMTFRLTEEEFKIATYREAI